MDLSHSYVTTNGVRLHLVSAGPSDGPLVILLHGFPEFWGGWRNQIAPLVRAGYRVWVPDQRGYNLSEKPSSVADYNLDALAADVVGLADSAEVDQVFLAGHDWGGAVAWWTANKYPERVRRLVIANVPHHTVMRQKLRHSRRQIVRSWYMFMFQIPRLPEWGMSWFNWRAATQQMVKTSLPGTFSPAYLGELRSVWGQPDGMRSMINWYRALFRTQPEPLPSTRITVPTLLLWGEQDAFLRAEMAKESMNWCDHGRVELFPRATHWILHEEPQAVSERMLAFFGEDGAA